MLRHSHNAQAFMDFSVWSILIMIAALLLPSPSHAREWKTYRLGAASVQVPTDWKVVSRTRNRQYSLSSQDKAYQLSFSWWFPDEPILGYDDIVSHKKRTVAGKSATWVHSRFPKNQTLQLVFDEARADKRKFLIVLEFSTGGTKAGSALFNEILKRVAFGRKKKTRKPPAKAAVPKQHTATPPTRQNTFKAYYDQAGDFTINQPGEWKRGTGERDNARIVTLAPPDNTALVLIVSMPAGPDDALDKIFSRYETLFFEDSFILNSIDGDHIKTLGGLKAHLLEFSGEVYSIEGVRLAFNTGRLHKYTLKSDQRAYDLFVLFPGKPSAALKSRLTAIVASFHPGKTRGPQGKIVRVTPAATKPDPATSNDVVVFGGKFGSDCKKLNLKSWRHPTRRVIESRAKAYLQWVMLCKNRTYPLFAVNFHYDPRGQTKDFFYPLYDDMLKANGGHAFSFIVPKDKLVINVKRESGGSLKFTIEEILSD